MHVAGDPVLQQQLAHHPDHLHRHRVQPCREWVLLHHGQRSEPQRAQEQEAVQVWPPVGMRRVRGQLLPGTAKDVS